MSDQQQSQPTGDENSQLTGSGEPNQDRPDTPPVQDRVSETSGAAAETDDDTLPPSPDQV